MLMRSREGYIGVYLQELQEGNKHQNNIRVSA